MSGQDSKDVLPEPLRALAQDLDSPGPALLQTEQQAVGLVDSALTDAALVDGALRQAGMAPRVHSSRNQVVVRFAVAAAVLGGVSAAAAWIAVRWSAPPEPPRVEQLQSHATTARAVPTPPRAVAAEVEPHDEREVEPVVSTEQHTPVPSSAPLEAKQDWLAEANRLRRAGQLAEAQSMYMKVVRSQPHSSAAYVARVAVAQLQLGSRPRSAVALLQQAQAQHPGGALDLEARQALVQAYRALGDAASERRELNGLVSSYPKSLGADKARQRLRELGGE